MQGQSPRESLVSTKTRLVKRAENVCNYFSSLQSTEQKFYHEQMIYFQQFAEQSFFTKSIATTLEIKWSTRLDHKMLTKA